VSPPAVKRGRGRPRKNPLPETVVLDPSAAHPRGYTRIYVDETGQNLPEPVTQGEPPKVPRPAPVAEPSQDVILASDAAQRAMIDEYGELARRVQLHAADAARFELLKNQIKSWFDHAPPDADGDVDGNLYRLHVTARERERRIRSMRELFEEIGMDRFLELCTVSIGALEDAIGKTRAARFTDEARTGSRRIKPIAKFAAAAPGV